MKRLSKIQRALKAPKDQKGYGYTYRKASDILQAVKPLLEEDNLSIIMDDRIIEIGDRFFLQANATLYGEDGQEIVSSSAFAEMDDHKGMSKEQATGSASSYARKYALCGLLAIDDSTDDPDAIEHKPDAKQAAPARTPAQESACNMLIALVKKAASIDALNELWSENKDIVKNADVKAEFTKRKQELQQQNQ